MLVGSQGLGGTKPTLFSLMCSCLASSINAHSILLVVLIKSLELPWYFSFFPPDFSQKNLVISKLTVSSETFVTATGIPPLVGVETPSFLYGSSSAFSLSLGSSQFLVGAGIDMCHVPCCAPISAWKADVLPPGHLMWSSARVLSACSSSPSHLVQLSCCSW